MANFTISATTLTFPDGTTQVTAAQSIPSGSKTTFLQASAPTGWTQCNSYNEYAIRLVSGTGAGTGGSVNFTTAFASQSAGGTVACTTLSISQVPSHNHYGGAITYSGVTIPCGGNARQFTTANTGGLYSPQSSTPVNASGVLALAVASNGSSGSHTHTFTPGNINLAVKYINAIVAVKS